LWVTAGSSRRSRTKKSQRTARSSNARNTQTPNQSPRKCEIYAIGNTVVYPHGRPPVPPLPWIRRDPSTEKPFAAKDMPLVRDPGKARLESSYTPGKTTKSVAVGREDNSFTISPSTRSRNRRAETWKLAGPLPASPA
jgi:hypothetical protein